MRILSSLVFVFLLVAPAHGQIIKVFLKGDQAAKQFKAVSTMIDGKPAILGEAKAGIFYDESTRTFKITQKGTQAVNEVWIADPADPKFCPYKLDAKGEKTASGKHSVVAMSSEQIAGVDYFIRDQSLLGLSREYKKRDDEIEELKKARESKSKGSSEWFIAHMRFMQAVERMKSWLDETCFPKAAEKFAKELDHERKTATKDAAAARLANAKAAIHIVEPPEELKKAAKEVMGDTVTFKQQESQHVRIIYREEVGEEKVKDLLELAETLIDGFRSQFVDPYLTEDYKDYLPDGLFVEFYFGPDDVGWHEKFTTKYYGVNWEGDKKEQRLKVRGGMTMRGKDPKYIDYFRTQNGEDFEGLIAHTMGHHLVDMHYNQGRANDPAPWLHEAVGNWISLEYLGRNSVTCVEFRDLQYAKKFAGEGGENGRTPLGEADLYHHLALDKGPNIDALAIRKLAEFEDPDIAKSYSLFAWIAKTQGEKGQRWLRACCNAGGNEKTFIKQWRAKGEEIYALTGQDIFKVLNDQWQKFAEQQVGAPVKKS